MKAVLAAVGSTCLDLLFPPVCLHCGKPSDANTHLLCLHCLGQMNPVELSERCRRCARWTEQGAKAGDCSSCQERPPSIDACVVAFDYEGPPSSLVRALKYGRKTYLAEGMAAYMAAQLSLSSVQMPDLIVPVPCTPLKKFVRGFNQAEMLAKILAKILNRPISQCLGRRYGGYSQAGLPRTQRLKLKEHEFKLKMSEADIADKRVLLVDDVITTGTTTESCARVLDAHGPLEIQVLAFARAL